MANNNSSYSYGKILTYQDVKKAKIGKTYIYSDNFWAINHPNICNRGVLVDIEKEGDIPRPYRIRIMEGELPAQNIPVEASFLREIEAKYTFGKVYTYENRKEAELGKYYVYSDNYRDILENPMSLLPAEKLYAIEEGWSGGRCFVASDDIWDEYDPPRKDYYQFCRPVSLEYLEDDSKKGKK